MPGFFDNRTINVSPDRVIGGAQVLTAGGTLSEAALAVLNKAAPADGSTAEPSMVDPGVQADTIKSELKKNAKQLATYMVAFVAIIYLVSKIK